MQTSTGLRRMTNKLEHRPAPDMVLLGGGSSGSLGVGALRVVEKLEGLGRAIKRLFTR